MVEASRLRVAMTQTSNQFSPMPSKLDDIASMRPHLEAIRAANVDHHVELVRAAAEQGARLVGLGELFAAPYFAITWDHLWLELAEPVDGPTVQTLRATAAELDLAIVAPIYELAGEDRFNTAVFIDAKGEVVGTYRKVHIPHGKNEQASFFERDYYGPSRGVDNADPRNISTSQFFPVFDLEVAKVGACICYDRHFDGVIRTLARQGAELVLCPAVTFGAKSQRMWELEFEVDAVRNNVFIAGSNRKGIEPPWNQEYFGGGYVVGPNGRLPDLSEHPELVVVDVPLEDLRRPDPAGWQLQAHRRDDVFG